LLFRAIHPDGGIMHAEIMIGNSPVMLTDESPKFPEMRSPQSLGGSPISLFVYVEDVDALENADDGDRRCGVEDPFGVTWWLASQVKNISRQELQKQYDEQMKQRDARS
jgi:PhnB protein